MWPTHLSDLLPYSASGHQALPESISLPLRELPVHTHRQDTQGQCVTGMKDATTVPLTLSQGLVDEVMLGLQLGDQVPAFQKLLQLLQRTKNTHVLIRGLILLTLLRNRQRP